MADERATQNDNKYKLWRMREQTIAGINMTVRGRESEKGRGEIEHLAEERATQNDNKYKLWRIREQKNSGNKYDIGWMRVRNR